MIAAPLPLFEERVFRAVVPLPGLIGHWGQVLGRVWRNEVKEEKGVFVPYAFQNVYYALLQENQR